MARDKIGAAPPLVPFPKIVMKARPTAEQLADRLRAPAPEGLELYLDAVDVAPDDYLPRLLDRVAAAAPPRGFTFLVEGPVRSLDGSFFDLTVDSPANRQVCDRLAAVGGALGAVSACVH